MIKIVSVILSRDSSSVSITKEIDKSKSVRRLYVETFFDGHLIFTFDHNYQTIYDLNKCFDSYVSRFSNMDYK